MDRGYIFKFFEEGIKVSEFNRNEGPTIETYSYKCKICLAKNIKNKDKDVEIKAIRGKNNNLV